MRSDQAPQTASQSSLFKVEVNLESPISVVSDKFLSVTIDAAGMINHWNVINFTCPRILNLAKGISPATLRVGGTDQDSIIFTSNGILENWESVINTTISPIQNCSKDNIKSDSGCTLEQQCSECKEKIRVRSNFTINSADWDLVNKFATKAGWEFVFGLNVLLRKGKEPTKWDSSNARELIQYTMRRGYKVAWELGNGMLRSACC